MLWEEQENLGKYGLTELDIPDRKRSFFKKRDTSEDDLKLRTSKQKPNNSTPQKVPPTKSSPVHRTGEGGRPVLDQPLEDPFTLLQRSPSVTQAATMRELRRFVSPEQTSREAKEDSPSKSKIWKVVRTVMILWFVFNLVIPLLVFFFHSVDSSDPGLEVLEEDAQSVTTFYNAEGSTQALSGEELTLNGLTVSSDGITTHQGGTLQIHLAVHNDTGEDVSLVLHHFVLNGYLIQEAYLYAELIEGETTDTEIWVEPIALSMANIQELYQMEFSFQLMGQTFTNDYTQSQTETFRLALSQEPLEQHHDGQGQEILSQGLRLVVQDSSYQKSSDCLVFQLYLENPTEHTYQLSTESINLGGYRDKIYTNLYTEIPPHVVGFYQYEIYLDDLRESLGGSLNLGVLENLLFTPYLMKDGQLLEVPSIPLTVREELD